jgi:peptide deformylase
MKRPLTYFGDPLLRQKGEPIATITEEIKQLALDMIETMDAHNGIGLAAPQVGQALRLFVLRRYIHQPDDSWSLSTDVKVYINPKILDHSKETDVQEEGCLSIPGLRLQVARPLRIKIEATDLEGKTFVEEIEGYNARVIFHENDHINGVLFIDRVSDEDRKSVEAQLREIKKKYHP